MQGWCQEIRLFAEAATKAGKDLNRRTFVEAMSTIKNYPGGSSPLLTFGPDKFSGPSEYQVVSLHVNKPPSAQCRLPAGHAAAAGRLLASGGELEAPPQELMSAVLRQREGPMGRGRVEPSPVPLHRRGTAGRASCPARPLPHRRGVRARRRSGAQPALSDRFALRHAHVPLREQCAEPPGAAREHHQPGRGIPRPRRHPPLPGHAERQIFRGGAGGRTAAPCRLREPHLGGPPPRGRLPARSSCSST